MICQFCHFWAFLNVEENSAFLMPVLEKPEKNLNYFMKISKKFQCSTNAHRHLFYLFFLKQLMAKFGLLNFNGAGNPA